jgi:hypothetical protein
MREIVSIWRVKQKGDKMTDPCSRSFDQFRKALFAAGLVAVLSFLASPASADTLCVSGNFSALIGTTCSIGNLTFTFTQDYGANWSYTTDPVSGAVTTTNYAPPTANDFTFTVLSDGFELTGPSTPISITAPLTGAAAIAYGVFYTVTDVGGEITGIHVSNENFSATGSNFSDGENNLDLGDLGPNRVTMQAFNILNDVYGTPSPLSQESANGTITSGYGDAYPFQLYAQYGNSASISGVDALFTFSTTNPAAPVPETGALTPLVLMALAVALRRCSAPRLSRAGGVRK